MAGIDRLTGKPLSGWPHVAQSLGVLFTTPKVTRIMRRHVGSDLPRLVDSPISPVTKIDVFAAVAEAVAAFEPRFRISRLAVSADSVPTAGRLIVDIQGVYYPRGHLGDFSVSEPKTVSVPL